MKTNVLLINREVFTLYRFGLCDSYIIVTISVSYIVLGWFHFHDNPLISIIVSTRNICFSNKSEMLSSGEYTPTVDYF